MHVTDGRTDRQNCDSNTVRCIACSRTVKTIHAMYMRKIKHQDKCLNRGYVQCYWQYSVIVKYRIKFKVAVFMHQVTTQRCPSRVRR